MKNRLCSDNFERFFAEIVELGCTVDEMMVQIKSVIEPVAADMSIGKLEAAFYTPPTPMDRMGKRSSAVLYEERSGYSNDKVFCEVVTGDGSKVEFVACPAIGCVWDDEAKAQVQFLFRVLFAICGRARLADIVAKTMSRDMSTGLLNSNGFVDTGNRIMNAGVLHLYTAMYINLKNFKHINNQIGNDYGDAVIRTYALALSGYMEQGEVVARLGGDNFALLVKRDRKDSVLQFLQGVNLKVEHMGARNNFNIVARAGVYDINDGDNMPYIMNCISVAISIAKRSNATDVVIYNNALMERMAYEHELNKNFYYAIRDGEFVTYFQPKVNLEDGSLCGCEALARWDIGSRLMLPEEFVPLFESDGNICVLDFYIFQNVCKTIKQWQDKGLTPVPISVNFSKLHLQNVELADAILEMVNRYKVDSKFIEIELTELSDYNDNVALKKFVDTMKANGIRVSIDDFGTGYSSLNLLTDIMFDVVKLDKTFIDGIVKSDSKTSDIVVRNIVKMLKELDMEVIAEGVETEEQARLLKSIGCNVVQGYLYDRPLCQSDFEKRLVKTEYKVY